ncbi:MAG: diguanylate cyclase [Candidatus Omnitrophica bacterium]|nr:diguanylate cyclase [Candidatus Omnitrophota bacterium]
MFLKLKLKNSHIFALCILLSIIAFSVDLSVRWAIGGLVYIIVVLFFLQSSNNKHPYIFTISSSCLIVLSLIIVPPVGQVWRVLTNHALILIILWTVSFWFLHYKLKEELNSKLAAIVNSSQDAIWSLALDGTISDWNKSSQNMLGYASEEVVGRSAKILIPENEHKSLGDILEKVKNGQRIKHYETARMKKDGSLINVSLSVSPIADMSGNIIGASIIARDITERIEAQKKEEELVNKMQLEKTKLEQVLSLEEGLHKVLDLNKLVDFVIEKTSKILKARKCSLMLVDEETQELVLRGYIGLGESIAVKARMKIGDPIAGLVALEGRPVLVEDIEKDKRYLRKNRPSCESKSFVSAPIKMGDQVLGVLSVTDKHFQDEEIFTQLDLKVLSMITRQVGIAMEASKLYSDLKFLTVTDPLTGIYNFRYFAKTLDREISRSKRYDRPLCILMIDVDDFKTYNDTHGHIEGDILLKELSRIFKENVRDVDVACRYAGDEFVIILPDTEISNAEIVANKIKVKVEELRLKMKVSVSIGLAQLPKNKEINRYDFMSKADSALYFAKKEGKNRIHTNK